MRKTIDYSHRFIHLNNTTESLQLQIYSPKKEEVHPRQAQANDSCEIEIQVNGISFFLTNLPKEKMLKTTIESTLYTIPLNPHQQASKSQ